MIILAAERPDLRDKVRSTGKIACAYLTKMAFFLISPMPRQRIKMVILILVCAAGSACSSDAPGGSTAVVGTERLRLRSSTAEAARTVGELKSGDVVSIKEHAEADGVTWVRVNGPNGIQGWAQLRSFVEQEAVERSRRLADEIKDIQTQAVGRSKATLKLRLTPDRATEENVLTLLPLGTEAEIVGRERRPRPAASTESKEGEAQTEMKYDEWYEVRLRDNTVTPAGWIYGGSVELQIPPDIVYYPSSGRRIVGWQKLGTARDQEGHTGDHYLVLERAIFGSDQDPDFDRVKILGYDPATRDYNTPFREDLSGRFPVRLSVEGQRGTLEVPVDGSQQTIKYELDIPGSGKIKVTRLTPKEPVKRPIKKARKR